MSNVGRGQTVVNKSVGWAIVQRVRQLLREFFSVLARKGWRRKESKVQFSVNRKHEKHRPASNLLQHPALSTRVLAGTTCYPAEDGKNLAASQNIPASEHLSLIATLRSLIFGSWTSSANLITSIGRNQATKRNHFVRRTLLKKQKTPLCKKTDYKPRII